MNRRREGRRLPHHEIDIVMDEYACQAAHVRGLRDLVRTKYDTISEWQMDQALTKIGRRLDELNVALAEEVRRSEL